jgi:hypothetical protein
MEIGLAGLPGPLEGGEIGMKRLFLAAAVCAALLLPAAAAVASMPHSQIAGKQRPGGGRPAAGESARTKAQFVPLGESLAGTTTVSGYVYDSYHSPLAGIDVAWNSLVSGSLTYGTGTTDGSGHYSVGADATADGAIWAYPSDGSEFARGGRTWTAGGSDLVDLYPGRVEFTAFRGGPWADDPTSEVTLRLWGATEYSRGTVTPATPTSTPFGIVDVLDGTYNEGGSVKWFWNEGLELTEPITVTSGAQPLDLVAVSEDYAQRVWIKAPYWASGKPGATVTVNRQNFLTGWRSFVTGYSDDPRQSAYKEYGTRVSQSGYNETFRVKIPSTAKPGYRYFIGLQHVDESDNPLPLYIEDGYQVCTVKPSKTRITRNTRIRVTGIVPTAGHWGSQLGARKKVYLLWHKGTASVPTTSTKGWYRVGRYVKCTGSGAYTTPYFNVPATGTFCVFYEGDDWYWPAYSSTVKVTVR